MPTNFKKQLSIMLDHLRKDYLLFLELGEKLLRAEQSEIDELTRQRRRLLKRTGEQVDTFRTHYDKWLQTAPSAADCAFINEKRSSIKDLRLKAGDQYRRISLAWGKRKKEVRGEMVSSHKNTNAIRAYLKNTNMYPRVA